MIPRVFSLPLLPAPWLWPLLALTVLTGLAAAWRNRDDRVTPLYLAAAVAGVWWVMAHYPVRIHLYGLFVVTGFGIACLVAQREAARRKLPDDLISDLAVPVLLVALAGCRLLWVLLSLHQIHTWWDVIGIWQGGLSFFGVFFTIPFLFWYAHRRQIPFATLCDIIAPALLLGYAIGRIGCLVNGCCYGHECNLPWAMRFPDQFHPNQLTPPSHPAQLYSFSMAMMGFGLLQWVRLQPRFNRFRGQITLMAVALLALERMVLEIFRAGATAEPSRLIPHLTQAQTGCVAGLVVVAVLWMRGVRASHVPPG